LCHISRRIGYSGEIWVGAANAAAELNDGRTGMGLASKNVSKYRRRNFMKTKRMFGLFAIAAVISAACTPAANSPANSNMAGNANANVAAKSPTKEALVALETKAFEAWKNKDAKYFEGFLADNYTSINSKGEPMGRADLIKEIGSSNCEVKSSSFSDEVVTPISADAAVITMKVTGDYNCGGKKGPSPVRSASLYTRSGDTWKAAYHNEVAIIDPKDMKAPPAKPEAPASNKAANTAANSAANTAASPAASADAATDSLMALMNSGWNAWKERDAKKLGDLTADDAGFVDPMGQFSSTKADTIKAWTEPKCDIQSVSLSNGKSTMMTKDVVLLTLKGDAKGTCEGMPLGPLWQTAILVKSGDTWKLAYMFEQPAE
jgi:ketosteroid isomerase-like protein